MAGRKTKIVEKPTDFRRSIRKLISILSIYKVSLSFVVFTAISSTIFNVAGPKVMAMATDELVRGVVVKFKGVGVPIDFGYIGKILIVMISLYLMSWTFGIIQSIITAKVATKVSFSLREQMIEKIHRLPIGYFNEQKYGDVLSKITNDVDVINTTLSETISSGIVAFSTVLGVILMMLTISFKMTLIAISIVPIVGIVVSFIIRKSQKYFSNQQKFLGELNGIIEEYYTGHNIIKLYNQEEKSLEAFGKTNEKLRNTSFKAEFISGLMMPIMHIISNIGYVVICVVGVSLAASGNLTIGGIQAFMQYVRRFTQPIAQLGNILNELQLTAAASERIFEFLEEDELRHYVTSGDIDLDHIQGLVEFRNVQFGYDERDKRVIDGFSAKIKPGQKVAIVGPTGAGKTTIIKLLMGFYELNKGEILIDNHNITEFSKEELRAEFTIVLQDTWLFNGTIMDNIRYGRLDASDDEVFQAAKAAHIDYFIRTLPHGYDTVINEEADNISQGQKQLITIARAMLAHGSILILDEATSSVDTRTEIKIQKAMDKLMEGRTCFVIAHRLSTIIDSDLILVMKEGNIIEQGSHSQLIAQDGYYADLFNSQF
ncbi:ABC transporter ATP-binding protein [Eubacteriales bacterium KG127]